MRKASAGSTLRFNAYLLAYRDHPITYPKVFGKLARYQPEDFVYMRNEWSHFRNIWTGIYLYMIGFGWRISIENIYK